MSSPEEDDALAELFDLLERWRQLTGAETEAITSSDWTRLEQLQAQKSELQQKIEISEQILFRNNSLPESRKAAERERLKEVAAQLLGIEEQNRKSLASLMEQTDQQLKASDKTMRSLRGVQNAYGSPNRSFWQAYS